MKTTLALLAFMLFVSTASFAQTEAQTDSVAEYLANQIKKVFSTKVDMNVDATLFPENEGNIYMNEKAKAMIMTLVAPQSFAKAEEHFDKESKKDGYKLLEKKKFSQDGKNFLYQKGSLKVDGKKAMMYLYAIEATEESTIFFTAVHMLDDEKKFFPAIEKAALSAKLAEQQ